MAENDSTLVWPCGLIRPRSAGERLASCLCVSASHCGGTTLAGHVIARAYQQPNERYDYDGDAENPVRAQATRGRSIHRSPGARQAIRQETANLLLYLSIAISLVFMVAGGNGAQWHAPATAVARREDEGILEGERTGTFFWLSQSRGNVRTKKDNFTLSNFIIQSN